MLAGFQGFIGSTLKSAFENSVMFSLEGRRTEHAADDIAAIISSFSLLGSEDTCFCVLSRTYLFKRRT